MTDLRFVPGQVVDASQAIRWGSFRVAEYRIKNALKWWSAIVSLGIGNPVLYLISIGLGIGALIDKNTGGHGIDGVSYLQFVAPALIASSAIQGIMEEVTFPVMDGFTWNKLFYAMAATSVNPRQIANGIMLAAVARAIFTTGAYALILLIFGAIPVSSLVPLFLTSVLAGSAWAAAILAVACRIKRDDGIFAVINRFIVAPMFLFSGTFYPLNQLPIYLQWIGWISPLWHATDAGRVLTISAPTTPTVMLVHFAYFACMLVGGMLLVYPVFERRLSE